MTTATRSSPATVVTTPTSGGVARQQRNEPSLPVAVQEAGAAVTGGHLYVVGGYDNARNSTDGVFVFDGSTWSRAPSLPIAVNHPGVAALGGDVYVAGGFTPAGATNRVFVRRASSTGWTELASLHRARGAPALVPLAGKLYAIGGRDRSVQVAVPEVYDPVTSQWVDIAAMPAPRNHVAGYVDGGVVCVAGGRTPDTSAAVDCFDPVTATWARRATLPVGTSGAAAAVIGGATIVAGGEPAGETRIVGVVQILRRRDVDRRTDARPPSRHRVRGVRRPPLDVRRRHGARLPSGRDLHVDRALSRVRLGPARLGARTRLDEEPLECSRESSDQ